MAQGTDPDYMWAVTVMLYWLKLVGSVCSGVLSILWLVHVVRFNVLLLLMVRFRCMKSVVQTGSLGSWICCSPAHGKQRPHVLRAYVHQQLAPYKLCAEGTER